MGPKHIYSFFLWLKLKRIIGTSTFILDTQQISIQYREGETRENISCVSGGQGEKFQPTVYKSSTSVSYWFCPRFFLGSGHSAAFGGTFLFSPGVQSERTPMTNKWLKCVANHKGEIIPQIAVRQWSLLLAATSSGGLWGCKRFPRVGQVQEDGGNDFKKTQIQQVRGKRNMALNAPCMSSHASGGELVTCEKRQMMSRHSEAAQHVTTHPLNFLQEP